MKISWISFSLLLFIACQSQQSSSNQPTEDPNNFNKIEVAEFAQQLKVSSGAQLVDVRTPEEFGEGHIEGATNINYHDADFKSQLEQLNKEKPVFVYCRSGGRSGRSMKDFKDLGFKKVYDLKGGFNAWSKAETEE